MVLMYKTVIVLLILGKRSKPHTCTSHRGSFVYTYFMCVHKNTVLPALRANSCIAIDRLMIELLDFHIPFLSFTNAGFKGYGKNLLNRRLRITQLPYTLIHFRHFILTSSFILVSS